MLAERDADYERSRLHLDNNDEARCVAYTATRGHNEPANTPPDLPGVVAVLPVSGHRWAYSMSVQETQRIPGARLYCLSTNSCFQRLKDNKIASNLVRWMPLCSGVCSSKCVCIANIRSAFCLETVKYPWSL